MVLPCDHACRLSTPIQLYSPDPCPACFHGLPIHVVTTNTSETIVDAISDCKDALYDNLATLNRMNNRIGLLRTEVEKRGMRWQFDDSNGTIANDTIVNDASDASYGQHIEQNGGDTPRINANSADIGTATTNGRLTDAELVAQIEARMSEHENEGVHL